MTPLDALREYWRRSKRDILVEHKVPGWMRPAERFLAYLFFFMMALVAADLLAALSTWLLSRYYLWHHGSLLLRERQFTYYSLLILVLSLSLAWLHLLVVALMQRYLNELWLLALCIFVSSALAAGLVYRVVPENALGPQWLVALTVVLAHAAGGALGFLLPPEKNRCRDVKWLDAVLR